MSLVWALLGSVDQFPGEPGCVRKVPGVQMAVREHAVDVVITVDDPHVAPFERHQGHRGETVKVHPSCILPRETSDPQDGVLVIPAVTIVEVGTPRGILRVQQGPSGIPRFKVTIGETSPHGITSASETIRLMGHYLAGAYPKDQEQV